MVMNQVFPTIFACEVDYYYTTGLNIVCAFSTTGEKIGIMLPYLYLSFLMKIIIC